MIAAVFACLAQANFADVQTLSLRADLAATKAIECDFDGDGAREIVIAAHADGKPFVRELELWRATKSGTYELFDTLALTPDVVAFTAGDVRDGGGEELVLFNAGGAFSWRPGGDPSQRVERLLECDFLWQAPDPEEVYVWPGLRDLDGDQLVDLVVPEPDGLAIAFQRRPRKAADAPWGEVSRIRVPPESDGGGVWLSASRSEGASVRGRPSNRTLALSFSNDDDSDERPRALVAISESVPAPQWLDWDGDGDLDLLAQTSHHLHVWTQASAHFDVTPRLSLDLPVDVDKGRRLDASYSSHAVDLDGDSRADCAIFAGDKRSQDVRTQGLFFTQSAVKEGPALFGKDGRPRDVLVFAGFISEPTFRDLDGDGLPELVLRTVRPDLIDQLRSASTESIDADLFVYRNHRGVLSRQPDVVWHHSIPLQRFQLTADFLGDLTGDGISELLVRDAPDRLRVLFLRASGAKDATTWTLFEKPLWEYAIRKSADVEIVPAARGGKPDLLVVDNSQVLRVRFR